MKRIALLAIIVLALISGAKAQMRHYYQGADFSAHPQFSLPDSAATVAVEARCALGAIREEAGDGRYWWGVAWDYVSPADYKYVILRPVNTDFGAITDSRVVNIEMGERENGEMIVTARSTVTSGINSGRGFNSLLLEWGGGMLKVFAGSRELKPVLESVCDIPVEEEAALVASCSIDISSLVVEWVPDMTLRLDCGYTEASVAAALADSSDSVEGVWRYLDRETDDNRARVGGLYELVIVRNGGGYDILYGSGARVNGENWRPLMKKGRLDDTPFERHYDLTWYDSMMEVMDEENHASVSDEGILTLEFPLYRSRLRFYRAGVTR